MDKPLGMKQETSVGEYNIRLRRIFSVVSLPVEGQIRHLFEGSKWSSSLSLVPRGI
jgi:hypothetical protein